MTSQKILHYRIGNFQKEDILFRYFEAQHTQFNKNLVLQILKDIPVDAQNALKAEIQLIAQLQHPNIITLYDYIDEHTTETKNPIEQPKNIVENITENLTEKPTENINNTAENLPKNLSKTPNLYLITELIQGKSLHDILTKISGLLPEQKAIPIFLEILNAFAFACSKKDFGGAIHPQHIFILPNDQVKISYIALSEVYAQQALIAEDKELMTYFAPERIRQEYYNINETTDVYILGVLLWQMLTGKNPYQGFNLAEIKLKILNEPLPSPKSIYPAVSDGLVEIIAKATAKNQKDRYNSLAEMQKAILQATKSENIIEEETETIQMEKRPFFNIPLILLLVCISWLGWLVWSFNNPEKPLSSEILFDLQNPQKIKSVQDSLKKAEAQRIVADSIRHFENLKKKKDIPEDYIHKAGKDETIESIARRYYMPLDSVLKWNNFTGKEKLKYKDGVKVKIKHLYHLRKDETLGQVAQKYNVSEFILKDVNQIFTAVNSKGKYTLFEGKEIVIPIMMVK